MSQLSSDQIIIGLVALGILLFNIGIVYAFLTGSAQRQFSVLRKLFRGAQRPWGREDDSLKELRQRVERLAQKEEDPKPLDE